MSYFMRRETRLGNPIWLQSNPRITIIGLPHSLQAERNNWLDQENQSVCPRNAIHEV